MERFNVRKVKWYKRLETPSHLVKINHVCQSRRPSASDTHGLMWPSKWVLKGEHIAAANGHIVNLHMQIF